MSAVSKEKLVELIRAIMAAEKDSGNKEVSAIDHATSCPGCYQGIIKKMNETSQYACADCGLPLGNAEFVEKIETCPNCGGSRPKAVNRWR